ncbi:MAG TPA: hybrid sensor histidine kinase/response regulator, partial [Planctomycetes bacterium]|nr:hybrid sensor histidine kinase/response regulator [Planctomycetota bacterium]
LDFSKIEAGHMEVYGEPIVLQDLIEESSLTAEGLLLERPIELETEVEEGLPEIESDFTRLKQVLNNLLGNAIKATETGHVSLEARHGQDGGVVIAVEDTGCGIPPEKLDTIFEAFKQIDDSSRKR